MNTDFQGISKGWFSDPHCKEQKMKIIYCNLHVELFPSLLQFNVQLNVSYLMSLYVKSSQKFFFELCVFATYNRMPDCDYVSLVATLQKLVFVSVKCSDVHLSVLYFSPKCVKINCQFYFEKSGNKLYCAFKSGHFLLSHWSKISTEVFFFAVWQKN